MRTSLSELSPSAILVQISFLVGVGTLLSDSVPPPPPLPRWAATLKFVIPTVVEGPAVSLSGTAKVPWANRLRVPFLHQRKLQIPRLPPDFLSDSVVSVNIMRLSSKKAAYMVALEICVVGNPEFARDDKGEGSARLSSRYGDGQSCRLAT